jgi:hypothetical protein
MDRQKAFVIICLKYGIEKKNARRRERKEWVKEWLNKKSMSCYQHICRELANKDPKNYRRYIRMDVDSFQELLRMVLKAVY